MVVRMRFGLFSAVPWGDALGMTVCLGDVNSRIDGPGTVHISDRTALVANSMNG